MKSREYTVEFLADLLLQAEQITQRQRDDVVRNEQSIRKRILRQKAASMRARQVRYEVSPVEVIATTGFNTPGGLPLSEDRIMIALAESSGVEYFKLDPLKLNESLITQTMSRPFARRHVCLPLERLSSGKVIFSIDNPYDLDLQESLRNLVPGGFELRLSAKSDILRVITDVYGFRKAVVAAEAKIETGTNIGNLEQLVKLSGVEDLEATDQHVVSAVEFLLRHAFEQRASD
ncbi:MAG: general secretion pathway protein E, partial [Bradymonadia bacterium]